jgi:hypothetical protein
MKQKRTGFKKIVCIAHSGLKPGVGASGRKKLDARTATAFYALRNQGSFWFAHGKSPCFLLRARANLHAHRKTGLI